MSQPSPAIELTPSLGEYFREVVSEAIKGREVKASPASETYLVQLLSDFAKPTQETSSPLTEPITFLLRDAMNASGSERFRRLQTLGDGVLYGVGFFGVRLQDPDKRYLVHVGSTAYGHAAQMLRTNNGVAAGPDVLDELARKFGGFVEVLSYVSDWVMAQSARGEEGLVKLYERWLRTGSGVIERSLGEQGLVVQKNPGGLH
jgi:hypothetical protein